MLSRLRVNEGGSFIFYYSLLPRSKFKSYFCWCSVKFPNNVTNYILLVAM